MLLPACYAACRPMLRCVTSPLTAPDAPRKRLPAWGAEADARFLWPQGRWHCRRWPCRALALSALVATEVVVREAGSINPPSG